MRWRRDAVAAGWLAAAAFVARIASADGGEPTYGRVSGDVTIVAGVGATLAPRGPRADADLRLRYLETAGLFASYEEGAAFGAGADPTRLVCTGAELRPLFLFRWLQGHETRRARWDLFVDSLGFELGAVFAQPQGAGFASQPGVEVALEGEVPILEQATGPWIALNAGLRWSDQALASAVAREAADRSVFVAFTVAWHQVVTTHVIDFGDEAPQ